MTKYGAVAEEELLKLVIRSELLPESLCKTGVPGVGLTPESIILDSRGSTARHAERCRFRDVAVVAENSRRMRDCIFQPSNPKTQPGWI